MKRLLEMFGVDEASPTGPGSPDYVKLQGIDFVLDDPSVPPDEEGRDVSFADVRKDALQKGFNVKLTHNGKGPNGYDMVTIEGSARDVDRFLRRWGFDSRNEFEVDGYDYDRMIGGTK